MRVADLCLKLSAAASDEQEFPTEEFQMLREAKLLVAPLSRTHDGLGLGCEAGGMLPLLRLLKQIGRGNLAVGRVYEGHANALHLIQTFGTIEQQARFAHDAHAGWLFGVWNTEDREGVSIHETASGAYVLRGAKTFASGAGHVARPIVTGTLYDANEAQRGWQMCVVACEGLEENRIDRAWWQPLGMRASASYRVDFTDIELTADDLLGAPGDYYRQPWFSGGAIRFAAVQLGGAESLFDVTRAYLRKLERTSDPYQRERAGRVATLIESGNLWLGGAAQMAEDLMMCDAATNDKESSQRFVAYANMMRTHIEEICLETLRLCERSIGARGLMRPSLAERIHRDLTFYLRQPAPDAALADAGRYALEIEKTTSRLWADNHDTL